MQVVVEEIEITSDVLMFILTNYILWAFTFSRTGVFGSIYFLTFLEPSQNGCSWNKKVSPTPLKKRGLRVNRNDWFPCGCGGIDSERSEAFREKRWSFGENCQQRSSLKLKSQFRGFCFANESNPSVEACLPAESFPRESDGSQNFLANFSCY